MAWLSSLPPSQREILKHNESVREIPTQFSDNLTRSKARRVARSAGEPLHTLDRWLRVDGLILVAADRKCR
jgi:hypothetical protein